MIPPPARSSPFAPAADGARVAVRLTPKASRNIIEGLKPTADGGVELAVKVTAAPERGRANAALVGVLAKAWGVPRSAITIVGGETDRHKQLLVHGARCQRLETWLEEFVS